MRSQMIRVALWIGVSSCVAGLSACGGSSSGGGTPPPGAAPGMLDSSFDGDGITTASTVGVSGRARATQIAPDGRIVVLGNPGSPTIDGLRIARYNGDGSLDSTLDGDGVIAFSSGGTETWRGLAVQADGKIVVGGDNGNNLIVRRFNVDGTDDTSFDGDGLRTIDLFEEELGGFVAVQSDGKIVVGGTQEVGGARNLVVVRLNANGTPDGTFGVGATRFIPVASNQDLGGMILQPDQRVLLVGSNGAGAQIAARLTTAGDLDPSFGPGGSTNTGPGHASFGSGTARDAVVDGAGALFISGAAPDGGLAVQFSVAKLSMNGTLDGSFGGTGFVTHAFSEGSSIGWGIVQQTSGRLVVGGSVGALAGFWALTPGGTTDVVFNGGAFVLSLGADGGVFDVARQSDDKVVGAGFADASGTGPEQFAVVRLQ